MHLISILTAKRQGLGLGVAFWKYLRLVCQFECFMSENRDYQQSSNNGLQLLPLSTSSNQSISCAQVTPPTSLSSLLYNLILPNSVSMRKKNHLSPSSHGASFTQLSPTSRQNNQENLLDLHSPQPISQQSPQTIKYRISKPEQRSLDEMYLRDRGRGQEMQRLNDTIDSMVGGRRRKDRLAVQQNSIAQEQILEQSLPNIGAALHKKDSSKLMDEIKRVQYKIKALKNEREDVNGQRRQYDAMRPFVEIHNQSMLYMQMMMANNQKQQNHHHCPHHQYSPPPYPVQYYPPPNYPPQYSTPPNYPQPIYSSQPNYSQQPNYSSQQPTGKPSEFHKSSAMRMDRGRKQYNMGKIRKFRVAVIAVYFHLLLPRFANRFTVRRFKSHCAKYLGNEVRMRRQHEQQIRDQVLSWNMIKVSQLVGKARAEKQVRRVKQTKTAKLIITEQYNGNDNYEFYLGDVELFLYQFLKRMKEAVDGEEGLEQIMSYVAEGNLPFAFPIDHYHLLDEIYSLNAHSRRLYWLNNRKVAKALILSCLFVKLITYSLFFPIKESEEWKIKMLKINDMKKEQMIEAEMAAVQMHLSGILLHKYCMQLIEEVMIQETSNCIEISQEAWPLPQSALCFQGSPDVQQAFSEATSRKIQSKPKKNSKKHEELTLQGYKAFKLYDFTYIKNLSEFEHLLQEISKASKYEQHVKQTIIEIVDAVYQRQLNQRKQQYNKMKTELLLGEKRLLSNKVNYSQLCLPKRTPPEKKLLKEAIELVRANQERQEQGSEDEQGEPDQEQSV